MGSCTQLWSVCVCVLGKAVYSVQNAYVTSAPGRRSERLKTLNCAHTGQSPPALSWLLPGPHWPIAITTAQNKSYYCLQDLYCY